MQLSKFDTNMVPDTWQRPGLVASGALSGTTHRQSNANEQEAPNSGSSRPRRSSDHTQPEDSPDTIPSRESADAELARAYAKASLAGIHKSAINPSYVQVPPESTLGRWQSALDSALKAPRFLEWARSNNVDLRSLTLLPSEGGISAYVNNKKILFTRFDGSGWAEVSRTLMSIAKVIAPQAGQKLDYPWRNGEVPVSLVAAFYAEPVNPTAEQVVIRAKQLEADPHLSVPENHRSERSVEALSIQRKALGNDANLHALIQSLESTHSAAKESIDFSLLKVRVDPRSSLSKGANGVCSEITALQMLVAMGYEAPGSREDALNLAQVLSIDLASRKPGADSGGAMPLTPLLSSTELRKVGRVVSQWKQQRISPEPQPHAGSGMLLNYLIGKLPDSARSAIRDNPSTALDQLLRLPDALGLGNDIQAKIKSLKTSTSAIESVSVALLLELDAGGGKSRHNLAGYDLYGTESVGASPDEIVRRFTTHLESKVGADGAPLAARLLLSVAAPELLVKNMPSDLVYGSHSWVDFVVSVSRIEQQVPGAAANMGFSQVMAVGDTSPVSLEGIDQLAVAKHGPVIDWGIANGVIAANSNQIYTDDEFTRADGALDKQLKELAWARTTLLQKSPTRKELALAELKRVLPEVDPEKLILEKAASGPRNPYYSLLDVYMSGKIEPEKWKWVDNDKAAHYSVMQGLSKLEPDINKTFDQQFSVFRKSHESAIAIQFKYQLSLLPVAERDNIKVSKVSFYAVNRPYDPGLSILSNGRARTYAGKPNPEESLKLKGSQGVLMRVDGGVGNVTYYSYFPLLGKIVKETGLPPKLPSPPPPLPPSSKLTWPVDDKFLKERPDLGRRLNIDDNPYHGEPRQLSGVASTVLILPFGVENNDRDQPGSDGRVLGTYFSKRNGALGITVGKFFTSEYDAVYKRVKGVTNLEATWQSQQNLKSFFLSLIPFYDGINDAIEGKVGSAIINITFDAFGFLVPGVLAGRRAYKSGKTLLRSAAYGVTAGTSVSFGVTDLVDVPKNLNKGMLAISRDRKYVADGAKGLLSRLRGTYGAYDVAKFYKEGDIAKGLVRGSDGKIRPVLAMFTKGAWYPYNILTKTPFGIQIAQFGVMSSIESGGGSSKKL